MAFEEKGYYRRIETIRGYFNFNMDLLKPGVAEALFDAAVDITCEEDDDIRRAFRRSGLIRKADAAVEREEHRGDQQKGKYFLFHRHNLFLLR